MSCTTLENLVRQVESGRRVEVPHSDVVAAIVIHADVDGPLLIETKHEANCTREACRCQRRVSIMVATPKRLKTASMAANGKRVGS